MRVNLIALCALLSACASLPHDGPSARSVAAAAPESKDYSLIQLDYRVSQLIASTPPRPLTGLPVSSSAPIDQIGEGDQLSVTVFQAGSGPALTGSGGGTVAPDANNQSFSNLAVDSNGMIVLPFSGSVKVAGLTRQGAAEAIRRTLVNRVVDPQVLVNITANLTNSVTLTGEVRNAGRFPLSASNDRLLDILASAGGATKAAADTMVTIVRDSKSASIPLSALMTDPSQNVRLAPRDQIRLIYSPRKFSTFGAFARASQVNIDDDKLSLAGAISRMGGLDATTADAASVMVFRFERQEVASALGVDRAATPRGVPVIYQVNLRDPAGYFVAGQFEVQDGDLIYVPRADAVEVRKFLDLATTVSQVAYDLSVPGIVR